MKTHHFITAAALTLWIGTTNPGHAVAVLTGSGSHLAVQGSANLSGAGPAYTGDLTTSFTGTWSSPALAAWQGTFSGTGPYPSGARPSGTATFDFSGLNYGVLPALTYFVFSDVDNGSGTEHIALQAFDSAHNPLTEWLNDDAIVSQNSVNTGGYTGPSDMPGWSWNATTSTYTFDGTTVPGNPTVGFWVTSNVDIASLVVVRDNSSSNFGMAAPVPEPSSMALLTGCFGALFIRRRRPTRHPLCVRVS
jgi:hypothetical protein